MLRSLLGRLRAAWAAFLGVGDDRYIRRDEVPDLLAATAEADARISSIYDSLSNLARKVAAREKRAFEKALERGEIQPYQVQPDVAPEPSAPVDRKARLRQLAAERGMFPMARVRRGHNDEEAP